MTAPTHHPALLIPDVEDDEGVRVDELKLDDDAIENDRILLIIPVGIAVVSEGSLREYPDQYPDQGVSATIHLSPPSISQCPILTPGHPHGVAPYRVKLA